MASSNKIIAFCLCFISSITLCVESQHRHGDELATLLAAGIVTALLKKGSKGKHPSSRHVNNIILQHHPAHGLGLEEMMHSRGLQNLEFHGYGLPPAFGGMRYTMAGLDTIPLSPLRLKALNGPTVGMNLGPFPPLPHMIQNNEQAQVRKSFDIVHNIIRHERTNQAPAEEDQTVNGPTLNEPTVTTNDDKPFNYEQKGHSHVQNGHPHVQNGHPHVQNGYPHNQNDHSHVQHGHSHVRNDHSHVPHGGHSRIPNDHSHVQNNQPSTSQPYFPRTQMNQ